MTSNATLKNCGVRSAECGIENAASTPHPLPLSPIEAERVALSTRAALARDHVARSGNGTIAEVAAFFGKSQRQIHNWKDDGLIGHSRIGRNVWFSPDDVAAFGARYHRAGKFDGVAPSAVRDLIKREWREFLSAECGVRSAELEKRVARIEEFLQLGNQEIRNQKESA